MDEYAAKIFAAYGLTPVGFLPPQKGYRNTSYAAKLPDGNLVNLITYKNEPGSAQLIRRTNDVADYLAWRDLPVRRTYDKRILCLNSSAEEKRYAALYDYLPGDTIPWEAYTKDHVKVLGMALSAVHHELADYPPVKLPRVHEQYAVQLQRMEKYFSQEGVRRAMAAKLQMRAPIAECQALLSLMLECKKLPAQQALHMDFVRGNILFQSAGEHNGSSLAVGSASISGILDFEKTAYGHPLFDIARTLAFLLVDCKYKTEAEVRKYFIYSGYAKRGPKALPLVNVAIRNNHIDLLERLVDLFLLHDFYKFLRHNPYESLSDNEHYQRTVKLCLQRGLSHSI